MESRGPAGRSAWRMGSPHRPHPQCDLREVAQRGAREGQHCIETLYGRIRSDRAREARRSRMGLFANGPAEIASRLECGGNVTEIVDYSSLQTAIAEYLARDQDSILIARILTFIQLAEAKFNRQLFVRQMEQRAIAVVDLTSSEPEFIALPSDFQSMRRVRL